MDADSIRNTFYVVASIALILVSFSIIAIFYLIFRLKKIADQAVTRLEEMTREISDQAGSLAKTWGRITTARLFIRILKLIF